MRKPIIAANWKMNKTKKQALEFARKLIRSLPQIENTEIAIAPPFTLVDALGKALEETDISLASQNVYYEDEGAFTGEISTSMLKDLGCKYVIVGHSERRVLFDETDELVNKKIKAVFKSSMLPILCVGENLGERKAGKTESVIEEELRGGLRGVEGNLVSQMVIAYEPIWAIGTGETALPEDADSGAEFIRELIADMYNQKRARILRIQYGGSVKPQNVEDIMVMPNVDGALIGGASLDPQSFVEIIEKVEKLEDRRA